MKQREEGGQDTQVYRPGEDGRAVGPWEHGVGEGVLGVDAELRLRCGKLKAICK